ncbi:hypothetical protein EMIT0P291_80118 [Pseudomonas sp. IT-P291]
MIVHTLFSANSYARKLFKSIILKCFYKAKKLSYLIV